MKFILTSFIGLLEVKFYLGAFANPPLHLSLPYSVGSHQLKSRPQSYKGCSCQILTRILILFWETCLALMSACGKSLGQECQILQSYQ